MHNYREIYVNENTLIRGFQYKDKEGNELLNVKRYADGRYTLMVGTLMSGLTVY